MKRPAMRMKMRRKATLPTHTPLIMISIRSNSFTLLPHLSKPTPSLRIRTCCRGQGCKGRSTNRPLHCNRSTRRCSRTMWTSQKPPSYASRSRPLKISSRRRRSSYSSKRRKQESLTNFERLIRMQRYSDIGCSICNTSGRRSGEKKLRRLLLSMKPTGCHSLSDTDTSSMNQTRRVASTASKETRPLMCPRHPRPTYSTTWQSWALRRRWERRSKLYGTSAERPWVLSCETMTNARTQAISTGWTRQMGVKMSKNAPTL